MRRCDVLICGAGISGLLLAAELSKQLSVIVVERNARRACSTKFWLTRSQSLASNGELRPFVDSEWSEMGFIASSGAKFIARGEYVLWDTARLEDYLVTSIEAAGGAMLYETRFYTYNYMSEGIVARANDQSFACSLLIDCMGFSSPIIRSSGAVSILGYHHLYGRVVRLKEAIAPIAADNVIISDNISLFEVFPRADGTANAVIIAPASTIRPHRSLAQDFNFIVEKSHYSRILEHLPGGDVLQGVVPVGIVKTKALDRIVFFGESGQLHPASTGTCLNRLLLQYKAVATKLVAQVRSGDLRARDLRDATIPLRSFAARFHQNMFLEQLRATSGRGEAFVELLNCIDQKSIDDFVFGELSPRQFLRWGNLIALARRRNFVWLKPLLRTILS
ncbi:MAG: Lycopene beta and epsilon cyclase [Bradyrhizobium sp.]|nr:Lycopene beta and epsilon cyclase [Bradyrhizobium sp.]